MPYKSKKPSNLLPSIVVDYDDEVLHVPEVLTVVPVYQLKSWRRILEVDFTDALIRHMYPGTEPNTIEPFSSTEYWGDPFQWAVDEVKSGGANGILSYAQHELGVCGFDYRDGRLIKRQRPLRPTSTEDFSFREAAWALGGIREDEIRKAVERGDLLSPRTPSTAPNGRRHVNKHDLEDWVRRCWAKSSWVEMEALGNNDMPRG